MTKERIAIVGVGCRYPGGVSDAESFWQLLTEGRDAVTEIPADRWNISRFYDPQPALPGKSHAKWGGFIDGIDQFDPQFFGISPREAPFIDPQQRLLLETAWEAIEDAGMLLDFEKGTDLGVFVGISHNDYQALQYSLSNHHGVTSHSPTGTAHSIAANRISYCLNLLGPSIALDTACSSALTAVHSACEHIWTGRGDAALAGGVTVMIGPGGYIGFSQATMISPEGRCRAFDAEASGFVRGEGAGMVLLKSMSRAIEDGDRIQGVLLGTALNQDGHTNGISLPSPEAQSRLVQDACRDAGVVPEAITFVEAHGTGTAVGDPIEAHALADALCKNRPDDAPLPIGSVKSNLGHLETAAGIAGLMKAMLVLEHGQIPPSLHFNEPNPNIDFDALKLRVATEMEPLGEGEQLVGVNSFGFGGANAHVILAAPPPKPEKSAPSGPASDRGWPLVLSARSETALRNGARNLASWLSEKCLTEDGCPEMPDLVYTLGARRNHHSYRLGVVASTPDEVITSLEEWVQGEVSPTIREEFTPRPEKPLRVGFVFSGQGPQWWGMGRELMEHEPVFRQAMERCAKALEPWIDFSLFEELGRSEEETRLLSTEIAQPAIFAMQVSLAELWKSWGVDPAAIVGHSVGEVAASCIAGVFSIEEGARVVALRAKRMEECGRGVGGMLAVGLDQEETEALIEAHDPEVTVSAFNGPRSLSLSGPRESLLKMCEELDDKGVFARMVGVDHAFHHAFMQPASDMMETDLAEIEPQDETVPFYSTITGERCEGKQCDAAHWAQGIRQPVLFEPALKAMTDSEIDVWLEIGAQPALARAIKDSLAGTGASTKVVSSTRREREHEATLDAALGLHMAGVTLDFTGMTPSRTMLTLPAYAWDKSRWWHEMRDSRDGRLGNGGKGFMNARLTRANPTWNVMLDDRHMVYLKDHKVAEHLIFPAAGFIEIALEAGREIFNGQPFAVEDFEIRKPLLLKGDPADLVLEISFSPSDRTFEISSKPEQSTSWSTHVVGSMRDERIKSAFADATLEPDAGLQAAPDMEEFYAHMADLGLRYGDEFKPLRELAVGKGLANGRVSLSENIAHRAGEYALHPVLLDGALHVFSAGAATLESKSARTKLPVRFGRILFLGTPGKAAQVRAKVQDLSDEFLEGDVEIYDESGKPCVLISGFRAVAVADRQRGSGSGERELIYHIDWERQHTEVAKSPVKTMPLKEIHDTVRTAIDEVIDLRGEDRLAGVLWAFEDLAGAQVAQGLRKMGVKADQPFNAQSLGVSEPMEKAFMRLTQGMQALELLKRDGDDWKAGPAFERAADSADTRLREFVEQNPGNLPEGLLCANNCAELGEILRGDKDAVQVLFSGIGAELLEQLYSDGLMTSHWLAAIARAIAQFAERQPEGRGLRILEVGAGTGGLAAQVLPQLERGIHKYVFSDVSAAFFPAAAQKLASFPEVEYQVFDLEKPGTEQEFEPESFDFILGTNVLHAVKDMRESLGHLRDLLAPGGNCFLLDMATAQLWTDSIFGVTSGWWRFEDTDLRQDQPLIDRATWEKVLGEVGFDDISSLSGRTGPQGGEVQIGLLAQKAPSSEAVEVAAALPVPDERRWLILADEAGTGDAIAARLETGDIEPHIARRDAAMSRDDWKALLAPTGKVAFDRIVYCWALDATVGGEADFTRDLEALLFMAQVLGEAEGASGTHLNLLTRGAQAAGPDPDPVKYWQGPALALFRVIGSELTSIKCRAIDLAPESSDAEFDRLWHELLRTGKEREVVLREEAQYFRRLKRGLPDRIGPRQQDLPLRLESKERGHLDTLRFVPFQPPACEPGQVLIDVRAAAMNFRDVLKALALYPGEAPDARIFGDEVAGTILAVGEGVTHVKPGDRVFGLSVFGISTQSLARGGDVRKMPDNISFEEAATLPVVFLTAWHSLQNVARIRSGETVLVHAGAGGVGMASIQIAQHLGAKVIASAGSPAKRDLLRTLGVEHVVDSRQDDFAEAVNTLTEGKGVDCVINALAGEAIPMGMGCLADFGRFIEIGKRDIYQNSRIPLWPLRKNASFHVVAMDAVFMGDESLTRDMLSEVGALVEKGALRALPYRSFPASRVDAAFRLMASGKHIGKVLISFAEPHLPERTEQLVPEFSVRPDGAYVVTGSFGGYGKVIASWLVESGAKELVLTGRSGPKTEEDEAFVEALGALGVTVHAVKADVSSSDDVKRVLAASSKPVRGVFHLAMVLDDGLLGDMTPERMSAVVEPKARGAWLLHEATLDHDLDCFVMFSSASSILGNASQGNYSAANGLLDSLAHHRHALGLPALTVNWGVLGEEGYVAANKTVAEFLERQGTSAVSKGEVTKALDLLLGSGIERAMVARIDWAKWRSVNISMQDSPFLEHIFAALEDEGAGGARTDWRVRIEAASDEDKPALVADAVRSIVGGVLRVKPGSLRDDQPLTDLGLDSLMGVEIEIAFETELGVALPPSSLVRARTIGQVAAIIGESFGTGPPVGLEPEPVEEPASEDVSEVDLEALSEEDLEELLDNNPAE